MFSMLPTFLHLLTTLPLNSESRHSTSNYVLQEVAKPRPLVQVLRQLSRLLLAPG
ncbi:hypothetical protein F383_09856 [Gossypium arboreum]|uniref:Uncharacterized protein n=1 Tax=Gossypium arboreum TaxID=29729 RepID=A0A0B0NTG5_GOSAR|nr:hypothetical protein F383_09856 [Gossypium arboreum]